MLNHQDDIISSRFEMNPYFYGRSEQEHGQILFVPNRIAKWITRKPLCFLGVRGSGKSSALKLLTWDVKWNVSSIKTTGSPEALRFLQNFKHIGVYYRVEDIDVPLWDRWNVIEDTAQRYFGTYIDLLYLDLLLDALICIRRISRSLFLGRVEEKEITKSLLKECFRADMRPRLLDLSFMALREIIADAHQTIRQLVLQDVSEEEIKQTYSVIGPGSLLKKFGDQFANYYPKMADWAILILLDDCNFLKKWQMKVLNTAVAGCRKPITYKFSSLAGLYPTCDTMNDDRPVILDYMDFEPLPSHSNSFATGKTRVKGGTQYPNLANRICKARMEQHFSKEHIEKLDHNKLLGPFNLEKVLMKKLVDSESDDARDFLDYASTGKAEGEGPAITKAWLSKKSVREYKLPIDLEEKEAKRIERQIASRYSKKWNHVAGMALCKEYGFIFPYSGFRVVLNLSAGSIRELLRVMSMIWEEAGGSLSEFIKVQPIPQEIQTRGIVKAAEARFELIDSSIISESGTSLQSICNRLGQLFSSCQSYPYILTTAETASISIRNEWAEGDVKEIIRKGIGSGWLLKREENGRIFVALHPVLSPKFQISFRNPFYYPEPISNKEIIKTLFFGSDQEANLAIKNVLEGRIYRYLKRHKTKLEASSIINEKQGFLFNSNPIKE